MGRIRIGIGGWEFPAWRKSFYPAELKRGGELAFASRALDTIEINGTFYRTQSPAVFAAWRETAPEDFLFSVKAHRATTHVKSLGEAGPAIAAFLGSGVSELGPKLGPILWQLPPAKKFDAAAMGAFLALLPERAGGARLRHAVEARHASFLCDAWVALAAAHRVAIVIVDSDKQALRTDVTADFVYLRQQRTAAAAPEGYDGAALDEWADRMRGWARDGRDVFGYFIAGDKARAPDAARAMMRRLGK